MARSSDAQAASTLLCLDNATPSVHESAWIASGAFVIGAVTIDKDSSIWYGAIVRADDEAVSIGRGSNLQDGVVVHADPGFPVRIGSRVTVGHRAVIHGATVEDECIVGMSATILNGAIIGKGSIVAAGAIVREGTIVPPGSLVAGVPAKIRGDVGSAGVALIAESHEEYVEKAVRHRRFIAVYSVD